MSMENSDDTIGNRTRDLPACSAVPQPTAPPGAPTIFQYKIIQCALRSHCGIPHILQWFLERRFAQSCIKLRKIGCDQPVTAKSNYQL